jgi:hypothetical protein
METLQPASLSLRRTRCSLPSGVHRCRDAKVAGPVKICVAAEA